jgi:transposase
MTFSAEGNGEIFKLDTWGRVRVPRARREELLDEFERGGSSAAQFASYVGIKYSTLAHWIQQRRQRERLKKSSVAQGESLEDSAQASGRWVQAVMEKNPAAQESEAE